MNQKTKQKILKHLEHASQPQDIQKIKLACGIGNWNTALKHCLELKLAGKINGVKTSKSWIFWSLNLPVVMPVSLREEMIK